MNWTTLTKYRTRGIRYSNIKLISNYTQDDSLQETVLIIYFAKNIFDSSMLDLFFSRIIADLPLSIIIVGNDVEPYFDKLLEILSVTKSKSHIMTNIFNSVDIYKAFDEIINGVWPAEERFESWKHYSILHIGDTSEQQPMFMIM